MDDIRRGDAGVLDRAPEGDTEERVESRQREPARRPEGRAPQQRERAKADEDGRGRSAEKPSDIPAKGWKDILLRVYRGISDDRILANAAAVTFYALLALFPAIAALVSIYGLFADPASIQQHLDAVSGVLPGGAVDVIRDQLNRLAAQPRGTLGVSFVIGLVISLWSANGGIKAMFDALNMVYEEKEERSFVRLNATSLAFTVSMIVFLLVAIGAIVAIPIALNYLPGFIGEILNYARWPAMLVLVALALACIYRYGPSRKEPRWRWLTWGSAFAALAWLGFSAIFSYYAANFGNFNKTYGSLGAVIGFMTWMWLSVAVILIGAKLNAEMEHQTARDSTDEHDKPLGARGAKMADTVGEAQSR
jgi:membrane protein